jgi:hypothetical protein
VIGVNFHDSYVRVLLHWRTTVQLPR